MPSLLLVSNFCAAQAPAPEPVTDQETELGHAVYDELKAKGEIVESSPLYDSLRLIPGQKTHPNVSCVRKFRLLGPVSEVCSKIY